SRRPTNGWSPTRTSPPPATSGRRPSATTPPAAGPGASPTRAASSFFEVATGLLPERPSPSASEGRRGRLAGARARTQAAGSRQQRPPRWRSGSDAPAGLGITSGLEPQPLTGAYHARSAVGLLHHIHDLRYLAAWPGVRVRRR